MRSMAERVLAVEDEALDEDVEVDEEDSAEEE
jgi:hypothetical protein